MANHIISGEQYRELEAKAERLDILTKENAMLREERDRFHGLAKKLWDLETAGVYKWRSKAKRLDEVIEWASGYEPQYDNADMYAAGICHACHVTLKIANGEQSEYKHPELHRGLVSCSDYRTGENIVNDPHALIRLNYKRKAELLDKVIARYNQDIEAVEVFCRHLDSLDDDQVIEAKSVLEMLKSGLKLAKGETGE